MKKVPQYSILGLLIAKALTVILFVLTVTCATAQEISINPRSQLVMNGNVYLVVNNASFKNSGNFSAGNSTVTLSGNADSAVSYVGGANSTTFNNLTVNKASNGAALKAVSNVRNTLTVNGGILYTDSNLVLKSDSILTARVAAVAAGSNIIGKSLVERYIPARRAWRLLTAPFYNADNVYNTWQNSGVYKEGVGTYVTGPGAAVSNGLDVSPQNNTSMYSWNYSAQKYVSVSNTYTSISAGNGASAANTGYFIFLRGDRTASNFSTATCNTTTLVSNGRLQVGTQQFSASSTSGGLTLIGNPYASPVDFSTTSRSNLINRFYVWDPTINTLGGYVMMDDLTNSGTYSKTVSTSTQTKDIQSGQAFFVQTNNSGAASITFNETNKSSVNNTRMFRPTSPSTNLPSQVLRTNLYIVNSDQSLLIADGIFTEFNDIFSDSVLLEDAVKFGNTNENLGILRYGTTLAAERRPFVKATDTVFLRLWKTTQQTYQFQFTPTNMNIAEIILEDAYLNTNTELSTTVPSTINFSVDGNSASAASNRFKIVFKNFAVLPVTITNVKAYKQHENVNVDWNVENEINMQKYEVEKSADGANFKTFATVAVKGNNNPVNSYSAVDNTPVQGNNFYRIKSFDISGQIAYSPIVKVAVDNGTNSGMSIYPNPVTNNIINLQLKNQPIGTYGLRLVNNAGQIVYNANMSNNAASSTLMINVPVKLVKGSYTLEVYMPNGSVDTQKVIVE